MDVYSLYTVVLPCNAEGPKLPSHPNHPYHEMIYQVTPQRLIHQPKLPTTHATSQQ